MKLARSFFRYSIADKVFLAKAAFVVVLVRLAFTLLPFKKLRTILAKSLKKASSPPEQSDINRIAWAVAAVSRHIPVDSTCLTQALAAEVMLNRLGQPTELCIGVAKGNAELQAHAWLEIEGQVVIGDNVDLSRYTRLPSIETGAR